MYIAGWYSDHAPLSYMYMYVYCVHDVQCVRPPSTHSLVPRPLPAFSVARWKVGGLFSRAMLNYM